MVGCQVLGWAQAMPMYAGEILELVQTLLERTLERCRAAYTEVKQQWTEYIIYCMHIRVIHQNGFHGKLLMALKMVLSEVQGVYFYRAVLWPKSNPPIHFTKVGGSDTTLNTINCQKWVTTPR